MSSTTVIQQWQDSYLCVAFLVAVAATVVADHLRVGDPPTRTVQFTAAAITSILWPAVIVGLAQWWGMSATGSQ